MLNRHENKLATQSDILSHFIEVFTHLNSDNIDLLDSIYAKEIVFKDPAHEISGLDSLKSYMSKLYRNLRSYEVTVCDVLESHSVIYVTWHMKFAHPKLNSGHEINFEGISRLKVSEGKIVRHQDYFDLGAMVYEQVPILGWFISKLKKGLTQ